jgi:hypothetical protein
MPVSENNTRRKKSECPYTCKRERERDPRRTFSKQIRNPSVHFTIQTVLEEEK